MKEIIFIFALTLFSIAGNAQLSLQYTNTRQAPASHNMTILDHVADHDGNIYIVYSDDPSKILLVSKVNAAGSTLWIDTVLVTGFPQVNVTQAKINISQNKLYVFFPGYGAPSPAGAIVAIYDLNGNYLNGFNASVLNNVWSYGTYGIHEKANGNILVYYSYGDQFTTNDTMYVKEFSPNFSPVWGLKFPLDKLTWHCPNYMDNNGNFYFTYTNDSMIGALHYLKSYTRKVDNAGNLLWTNVLPDVANKLIQKMFNGDIVLSGNNNPNGSLFGNNTGEIRTSYISDVTGLSSWTQIYNGPNNNRDEVEGLAVNQLNEIFIAGTEDLSKGFLRKYNQAGQLQYEKLMPLNSGTMGVYLSMLGNIHTVSFLNGNIHIKKILATTGSTLDSLTSISAFPIGKSLNTNNTDDDIFFSYSEGHCGANHLEVLRFCTKAICSNPDGIVEAKEGGILNLYPNPASNELYIQFPSHYAIGKSFEVRIFNMQGALVCSKSISSRASQQIYGLDISNLPKGMYILQCGLDQHKENLRFVKD